MRKISKDYQQTHMTGQTQSIREGMTVTEPLPVVSADEFANYMRVLNDKKSTKGFEGMSNLGKKKNVNNIDLTKRIQKVINK